MRPECLFGGFSSWPFLGACLRDSDLLRDCPARSGKATVLLLLTGAAATQAARPAPASQSAPLGPAAKQKAADEAQAATEVVVSLVERFAALLASTAHADSDAATIAAPEVHAAVGAEAEVGSASAIDAIGAIGAWVPAWVERSRRSGDDGDHGPPGEVPRLVFPPTLTAGQRFAVHEAATRLGLWHGSSGDGEARAVAVSARPAQGSSLRGEIDPAGTSGAATAAADASTAAAEDAAAAAVAAQAAAPAPEASNDAALRLPPSHAASNSTSSTASNSGGGKSIGAGGASGSNSNKGGLDLKALAMERAERLRQQRAANAGAAPGSKAGNAAAAGVAPLVAKGAQVTKGPFEGADEWLVGPATAPQSKGGKKKKDAKKGNQGGSGSGGGGGSGSKAPSRAAALPALSSGGGDGGDDEMAFLDDLIGAQAADKKAAQKADPGRGWKR